MAEVDGVYMKIHVTNEQKGDVAGFLLERCARIMAKVDVDLIEWNLILKGWGSNAAVHS